MSCKVVPTTISKSMTAATSMEAKSMCSRSETSEEWSRTNKLRRRCAVVPGRRSFRFFVFWSLLLTLALLMPLAARYFHGKLIRVDFDGSSIAVEATNCEVLVAPTNRGRRKIRARALAHRLASWSFHHNVLKVDHPFPNEPCEIRVKIPQTRKLVSEVRVESWREQPCRGIDNEDSKCSIADQRPFRRIRIAGIRVESLSIQGSMIDVDLDGVTVDRLVSVEAHKGAVGARLLRTNGTVSFKNYAGDIAATIVDAKKVIVNATTQDTDYCFAASNLTALNNATVLCQNPQSCDDENNVTSILAWAPRGSVSVTLVKDQDDHENGLALVRGESMSIPHLDAEGTYYLRDTRNWIDEKSKSDHLQVIQLQGPRQRSIGKFVHTTNPAYLYVRPWTLAAMSAAVLRPRIRIVYASAIGQCPYTDEVDDYVLGSWDQAIRTKSQVAEPEKTFLNARSTDDATSTWFEREVTGKYAVTETSLFKYPFGLVSIALSLALAAAAASCAFYVVSKALESAVSRMNAADRHLQTFRQAWAKYEAGTMNLYLQKTISGGDVESDEGSSGNGNTNENVSEVDRARCGRDIFDIVENLVGRILCRRKNSLEAFVDDVLRERGHTEPVTSSSDDVTLDEFREAYELWAIHRKLPCYPVDDDRARCIFRDKKLQIASVHDATTDAYTKVRFRTAAEMTKGRLLGETPRLLPGETSLSAFLRLRCVVTGLDRDFVLRTDLANKYWNFIDAMHITSPQPMTKGNLREIGGVELRRITIPKLRSLDGSNNSHVIDLDLAEDIYSPGAEENKTGMTSDSWRKHAWHDANIVFAHFVVIGVPPLVFALLAAFAQGQEQPVSNKDWCHYSQSWLGPRYSCFSRYSYWNAAISTATLAIWVTCAFHAILYYTVVIPGTQAYPAHPLSPLKTVTNAITYRAWLLSVGASFGYLSLSMVWWMLAVVVNPDEYLAYGVSALVLLSVVLSRTSSAATLSENLTSRMTSHVKQSLQFWGNENIARIPRRTFTGSNTTTQSKEMVLRTITTQTASIVGVDIRAEIVVDMLDQAGTQSCERRKMAVDAFARASDLSPHLVKFVLAKSKHDHEASVEIARDLATESAVALPAPLVSSLYDLIRRPRSASSIKRLANVWASEVLGLPGTVDVDLVAHAILSKFETVSFVRAFGFDKLPAFRLLVAKQRSDQDIMFNAAKEVVDQVLFGVPPEESLLVDAILPARSLAQRREDCLDGNLFSSKTLEPLSALPLGRLGNALSAWRHLKEGKRILLQGETESRFYEDLGELLFANGDTDLAPRKAAGMLIRFMLSRLSGRKSLMLREAPLLAEFVNSVVLPMNTSNRIGVESIEALLACKYGSDVNVRSFARECSISESLANSIAFMLASSSASSGGTAMFTLLTSLDLGASMDFLAESTSKTANPTRVLGLMALVQRTPHLPELKSFTSGLLKDFAVLHLGGEEPKIARLSTKCAVLADLVNVLCSRDEAVMRESAKRIHKLDRMRAVPDAIIDLLLFAYDDTVFDFEGNQDLLVAALLAVDGSREKHDTSLSNAASAVVAAIQEEPGIPMVEELLALVRHAANTRINSSEDASASPSSSRGSSWTALVVSVLNAKRELPMELVTTVVKACFKSRSLISQKPALAALEQLLQMSYVQDMNEAAVVSLSSDVAMLLDMEAESLESVIQLITQHEKVGPTAEESVQNADGGGGSDSLIKNWLKTGGSAAAAATQPNDEEESMNNAALFASKWTIAQTLSRRSIAGLGVMSEMSSVPLFYLNSLALNSTDPTQSSKAMDGLCHFMANNLGWEKGWIDCLHSFATRDATHCFDVLDRDLKFGCVGTACLLFGNTDKRLQDKLSRAPSVLLRNRQHFARTLSKKKAFVQSSRQRASCAALMAFCAHVVDLLPGVFAGEDGSYRLLENAESTSVASVAPRDVLAYALDLPAPLLGALNESSAAAAEDNGAGLRLSLLGLLGQQVTRCGRTFPGIVGIAEDHARAIMSLGSGGIDGLEEAATKCDLDPRLAEGLAILSASQACSYSSSTSSGQQQQLCNMPKLLNNAGLSTLCQWCGIELRQAAAIVAIVKLDADHAPAVSEALGLPSPITASYIEAMATCCQVANFVASPSTYAVGFAKLMNCLGPLATRYSVKDRRAAETAAFVVRICQGDAGPLMLLHNRLGIGMRDLPLLASLIVLCSPSPVDSDLGCSPDWMSSRHASTAARNLASVLHLHCDTVETLVFAGRGLRVGLKRLAALFQPILLDNVSIGSALALVLCIVHDGSASMNAKQLIGLCGAEDDTVRRYISSIVSNSGSETPRSSRTCHLLQKLASAVDAPPELVHFLLAMTTVEASRSVSAVIERYATSTDDNGTISRGDLSNAVRVLVAMAVGDESELRTVGYDSRFLRRLSFKVHRRTSNLVEEDDTLSEHHPIVFLLRFAHRKASCFDVKASLDASLPISYSICPQPSVLKAIFGLMAHDYRMLLASDNDESSAIKRSRFAALAEAMQVPLEPIQAIAGIAMRGSAVAENQWVSSFSTESARLRCCQRNHSPVYYGCESSDLRKHMKTLAGFTGTKSSVYLNSFMAGCSEDREFLTETLTPLAIKLKIHVELVVDIMRAAQRDRDALASLARRVLDNPSIRRLTSTQAAQETVSAEIVDQVDTNDDGAHGAPEKKRKATTSTSSFSQLRTGATRLATKVYAFLMHELTQASLTLLVIVDLLLLLLLMTGAVKQSMATIVSGVVVTLAFVAELGTRFVAFAWLNPRSPLDFFRKRDVHLLELGITALDVGVLLVEVVVFRFKSTSSLRFVKGLRLLKLFRIARVAIKVSSTTETEIIPQDNGALARYLSFLALLKLKDNTLTLDEWPNVRAILCRRLFATSDDDFVAVVLAVSRSHMRKFTPVIQGLYKDFRDTQLVHLAENWVDLWNRDMLAFVKRPGKPCLIDALDEEFWYRAIEDGPRGGLSVFLGTVCGMTTFVSEWLATIAQHTSSSGVKNEESNRVKVRYPPVAPRLLLALKRDNVLDYYTDEKNGVSLRIKPAYERPVENLLMSLVGMDHAKDRLSYQSDADRTTKLTLFVSLFSMIPRGCLPKALHDAIGLDLSTLEDLEKLLAPLSDVDDDAISRLSERIVQNLRPDEIVALRDVQGRLKLDSLASVISSLLDLLSCRHEDLDLLHARPLFECGPDMTPQASRLLQLIDQDQRASQDRRRKSLTKDKTSLKESSDTQEHPPSDEFSRFASSLIIDRVSPKSARQAWQEKTAQFASFIFGTALVIEGTQTRDPQAVSQGADVIAEALDFPSKQVNGFFALAAMDLTGFLELVAGIGDATIDQAQKLAKLFAFCQPLFAAHCSTGGATADSDHHHQLGEEDEGRSAETATRKYLPYDELCLRVDVDKSRSLTFDEYKYALHILGLEQSTPRVMSDFVQDDEKGTGAVSYENFERGMERRHKELALKLLAISSLDRASQTRSLALAIILLVMLFAFIFVGVEAFSRSNTLATVVNGALPALAGINLGSPTTLFTQLDRLASSVTDVVQLEAVRGHGVAVVVSAAKAKIRNALIGRA